MYWLNKKLFGVWQNDITVCSSWIIDYFFPIFLTALCFTRENNTCDWNKVCLQQFWFVKGIFYVGNWPSIIHRLSSSILSLIMVWVIVLWGVCATWLCDVEQDAWFFVTVGRSAVNHHRELTSVRFGQNLSTFSLTVQRSFLISVNSWFLCLISSCPFWVGLCCLLVAWNIYLSFASTSPLLPPQPALAASLRTRSLASESSVERPSFASHLTRSTTSPGLDLGSILFSFSSTSPPPDDCPSEFWRVAAGGWKFFFSSLSSFDVASLGLVIALGNLRAVHTDSMACLCFAS